MGYGEAVRSFMNVTSGRSNNNRPNAGLEQAYTQRYALENNAKLQQIIALDKASATMYKQGDKEGAQELLQNNAQLIKEMQGWRVDSEGHVLPTYDALRLHTERTNDEIADIQANQNKDFTEKSGALTGNPIKAITQMDGSLNKLKWLKGCIDANLVPKADAVFNSSLAITYNAQLDVKKQLAKFPRDPVTGNILGTKEQQVEAANLETILKETIQETQKVLAGTPSNIAAMEAPASIEKGLGTDTGIIQPKVTLPPNSDSEVSDSNTKAFQYGDDAIASAGESIRKGVLGSFGTATDALGKSLQFIKDIPNRQTRLTAGILGQDVPEYAQKGQPDQLTQVLTEILSQASDLKTPQKLDAPAIGNIDRIGNAIRSKEAPLWQEKYTNPMSEMLYKLLYKKDAGLPGAK